MSRRGRDFELAYKWLYDLNPEKYTVVSPGFIVDKITSTPREIDVLITYFDENHKLRRIGVECRDRKASENATWIEQLVTKKNDLELDGLIVVTTSHFTKPAIEKAAFYGVIIEEAEYIDAKTVDQLADSFYADFYYVKYELIKMHFVQGDKVISLKELFHSLPFVKQQKLYSIINDRVYYSFDANTLMDLMQVNDEERNLFFKFTENSFIDQKLFMPISSPEDPLLSDFGIKAFDVSIRMIPFKLSMPLNKSLSTFNVRPKSNKKYIAYFGADDEYFQIGYLDGRPLLDLKLKPREFYRLSGGSLDLNTIFPDNIDMNDFDFNQLITLFQGKFDMEKALS